MNQPIFTGHRPISREMHVSLSLTSDKFVERYLNDIAADDEDLAVFTAQIEQIEAEVQTLQSGQDTGNGESTLVELEMELMEINSDFWKG